MSLGKEQPNKICRSYYLMMLGNGHSDPSFANMLHIIYSDNVACCIGIFVQISYSLSPNQISLVPAYGIPFVDLPGIEWTASEVFTGVLFTLFRA